MPKNIQLTQIKVNQVIIDAVRQTVTVTFDVQDAAGVSWLRKEATFWATMPPQATTMTTGTYRYQPYPDTWFQLPTNYKASLIALVTDAQTAISGRFLS